MIKTLFGKRGVPDNVVRKDVEQMLGDPLFIDTMIKGNACLAHLVQSIADQEVKNADVDKLVSYAKAAFDENALAYFTGRVKDFAAGIYIDRAIKRYVNENFGVSDATLCQCIQDKLPSSNHEPALASKVCAETNSSFLKQVKAVARAHVESELEKHLQSELESMLKKVFQPYVGVYHTYTNIIKTQRIPPMHSQYSDKQHQYWSEVVKYAENVRQKTMDKTEQASINAAWAHGHRYWNGTTGRPVSAKDFPGSPELDRDKNRYGTRFHKFKTAAKRPTAFDEHALAAETQAFIDKAWAAGVKYWDHDGLPFVPSVGLLFPLHDIDGMDRHSPMFHHFRNTLYRPTGYDIRLSSAQNGHRTNSNRNVAPQARGRTTSAPMVLTQGFQRKRSHPNGSTGDSNQVASKLARTASNATPTTSAASRMPSHVRARFMTQRERNAERRDPASAVVSNRNIARRIIKSLVSQHVYDMGNVFSRIRKYVRVSKLVAGLGACSAIKQYRLGKPLSKDGKARFVFGQSIDTTKPNISLAEVKAPIVATRKFLGKGAYGQAWVASSAKGNLSNLVRFAVKLASEDDNEADKMRVLTKHVLGIPNSHGTKDYFINFPMLYGSNECNASDAPAQMRYALFSELADGALFDLMTKPDPETHAMMSPREFSSCIMQVIMGVLKLRQLGFIHDDLHPGNILYHRITPGGYWWYQVNGKDYYIENIGKLAVLWDFGMTKTISWDVAAGQIPTTDVYRLCSSIQHMLMNSAVGQAMDSRVLDFMEIMYRQVQAVASGDRVLGKYWEHLIHPFLIHYTANARFLPTLNATDFLDTMYRAAFRMQGSSPVRFADVSGNIINKEPFKVNIEAITNKGPFELGLQPHYATSQRHAEFLEQQMASVIRHYNVHRPRVRP